MLVAYCQLYFTVYCVLLDSVSIIYNFKTKLNSIFTVNNFIIIDLLLLGGGGMWEISGLEMGERGGGECPLLSAPSLLYSCVK